MEFVSDVRIYFSMILFSFPPPPSPLFSNHVDGFVFIVQHVSKHRHSLLPKFYGMHRIENGGNKIRFVVMNNLFDTDKPIHAKYDLKGSTVGRSAGEKKGKGGILKDLDVHEPFRLGPQKRALFLQQLEYDCAVRSFWFFTLPLLICLSYCCQIS